MEILLSLILIFIDKINDGKYVTLLEVLATAFWILAMADIIANNM